MKKISLLLFFFLLTSANIFAQSGAKIGHVDSEVILQQLPEAIKAQGELDALISKWNAEIDTLTLKLQQEFQDYQKQAANMPEAKRAEVEQQLVQKQRAIEELRRSRFSQGGEVYKKQDELLKPVKEKVFKAIEEVAKDEGMQYVFDKTGDILLLYADSQFDITFKVLDKLKRGK